MMYIKLTLLSLFFQGFLFDNAASSALATMPDCTEEQHKNKLRCICKNPANWDTEACQDFWKKPSVVANTESRIVGGELAPRDAYPWFARLVQMNGDWRGCGGMLIAKEYVLTAAHCVGSGDANHVAVQIGAVCPDTSNNNCGQPIQTINVASVKRHPEYNGSTKVYDFNLLKLVSRANAEPVPIDQGNIVDNYSSNKRGLYAAGFGTLSYGGNISSELRHVELAFVPRNTCNSNYGGRITDTMMCAADPGQDACSGDSGGPLYDQANNAVVGVVSFGSGCALPDKPGVYAQISSVFDWIKSNTCGISNHSDPQPDYCISQTNSPTKSPTSSPTKSPTSSPTKSPTSSPTKSPTSSPTKPPTSSPTKSSTSSPTKSSSSDCVDTPFRFKLTKNGNNISRGCVWVAKKDTSNRCNLGGVSSMCPSTCGTCTTCVDGANRFRFPWNGKTISRSCDWAANKATAWRCSKVIGMIDTCRSTCESC